MSRLEPEVGGRGRHGSAAPRFGGDGQGALRGRAGQAERLQAGGRDGYNIRKRGKILKQLCRLFGEDLRCLAADSQKRILSSTLLHAHAGGAHLGLAHPGRARLRC